MRRISTCLSQKRFPTEESALRSTTDYDGQRRSVDWTSGNVSTSGNGCFYVLSLGVGKRGLDKAPEQRMRFVWLALKFGMVLAGDEVRVIAQFDNFRERTIRGRTGNLETLFAHF